MWLFGTAFSRLMRKLSIRWPSLSSIIISLTAPRDGNSLPKFLILLILVSSAVPPVLYPAQKSALLIQIDMALARANPEIWLTSLTNKVAIVIDLRAQSTRRFLYQRPLTDCIFQAD
jgi:hypothetical protein